MSRLKDRPGLALAYSSVISTCATLGIVAQAFRWEWFLALCGVR